MQSIESEYLQFCNLRASTDKLLSSIAFSKQLFQQGRFPQAAAFARQSISLAEQQSTPLSNNDLQFFCNCFYANNDLQYTLQCSLKLLTIHPDNHDLITDTGLYYFLLGDTQAAEQQFLHSFQLDSENARACDGLAHLYGLQHKREKMQFFGNKALEIKDKEAFSKKNLDQLAKIIGEQYTSNHTATELSPTASRNIISFSLWGEKPEYTEGAILNATIAPVIYPGWKCRFYCDTSVQAAVIEKLKSLGAEVKVLEKNNLPFFGLFWRFFVADDANVDRFIIRDCDCVVNTKERIAVDEWIASGKLFHMMRDYASHTELIHAGMWGAVRGAIPKASELIVDYYDRHAKERTIDQRFLRHYIWPLAKQSHLCHDSQYNFNQSRSYQSLGCLPDDLNIGMNWQAFFERLNAAR